jgi:hypothetical protein
VLMGEIPDKDELDSEDEWSSDIHLLIKNAK